MSFVPLEVTLGNKALRNSSGQRTLSLTLQKHPFAKGAYSYVYLADGEPSVLLERVVVKKMNAIFWRAIWKEKLGLTKISTESDEILDTEYRFFKVERDILSRLQGSKFITNYFGYLKDRHHLYLAIEECNHATLYELLVRIYPDGTPPKILLYLLTGIVQGVKALHEKKIIHNDIKPDNLLLGKDSFPKIADFGLSVKTRRGIVYKKKGITIGTMFYIAPEKITAKKFDGRADCWSLAITFAQMVFRTPITGFFKDAPVASALCSRAYEYQKGDAAQKENITDLYAKDFGEVAHHGLAGDKKTWSLIFKSIIFPLSVVKVQDRKHIRDLDRNPILNNYTQHWTGDTPLPVSETSSFRESRIEFERHVEG